MSEINKMTKTAAILPDTALGSNRHEAAKGTDFEDVPAGLLGSEMNESNTRKVPLLFSGFLNEEVSDKDDKG